jgi:hypothetical protein
MSQYVILDDVIYDSSITVGHRSCQVVIDEPGVWSYNLHTPPFLLSFTTKIYKKNLEPGSWTRESWLRFTRVRH